MVHLKDNRLSLRYGSLLVNNWTIIQLYTWKTGQMLLRKWLIMFAWGMRSGLRR